MWSPTHPARFACVDGMGRLDVWNLNTDTEVSRKITKIALKNRKLEIYWIICEIPFIPRNVKGLCDCSFITKKANKLCALNNKQPAVQNWREKHCCQEHCGVPFTSEKHCHLSSCPGKVSFIRQLGYFHSQARKQIVSGCWHTLTLILNFWIIS